MFMRQQVSDGMTVRSTDGENLGRVCAVGEESFHIVEIGHFLVRQYLVRYADIQDIRDGEIILAHGRDSLSLISNEEVAEPVRHEKVDIRSPNDESKRSLSLDPDESSPRRS